MSTENSAYNLPESFYDFAFMPKFNDNIQNLSELAEKEDWNYKYTDAHEDNPILKAYIKYTYKRIAEEKKVSITKDEKSACWNTGLITTNHEQIFAVFNKNNLDNAKQYWHFYKFCREGEFELNHFIALPDIAHYFDDPSHIVFDWRKELRTNIEHIVSDNRDRFPSNLKDMNNYALRNLLDGAIKRAIDRAKRNYKTAIPQYYNGGVQLLLPLCLTDPQKADLALVLERFNDFYRASTCLTLDMAYNNARQLARPDKDWLQP